MKNKYLILILLLLCYIYISNNDLGFGNPYPSDILRVLIVYNTADYFMTRDQINAINSVLIDQLVDEEQGELKRWDQKINLSFSDHDEWFDQTLEHAKEQEKPYIIASKGNKFREGKIISLDETLEQIKSVK